MNTIIPVLKSLGVTCAISMDDEYTAETEPSSFEMISCDDLFKTYGSSIPKTIISKVDELGLLTIGDILHSDVIDTDSKSCVRNVVLSANQSKGALSLLELMFSDSFLDFKKIGNVSDIPFVQGNSTIWFIDKEMQGRNVLHEVISSILKDDSFVSPVIIVVFTSDDALTGLNQSWDKRYSYLLSDVSLDKELCEKLSHSFYVISKSQLQDKMSYCEQAAIEYIDDILTNSIVGYCVYFLLSQISEFCNSSLSRLFAIARNSNRQTISTILYNIISEGEVNCYRAFDSIRQLMQEEEYTKNYSKVEQYQSAMLRIAHSKRQNSDEIRIQTLKDIAYNHEWSKYQYIQNDINLSYADVSFGDIFAVYLNDKKYIGILITQPCDCVVRKNGSSIDRKATLFTLPLYKVESIPISSIIGDKARSIQNNSIIINCIDSKDSGDKVVEYIDITKYDDVISVPCFILDLTSFDNFGKALLLDSAAIDSTVCLRKNPNWCDYKEKIKISIARFAKFLESLDDCNIEDKKQFISLAYNISFSEERKEFEIERIGRLKPNLAEFAVSHYVGKAFRTGKESLVSLHDINHEINL